MKSSQEPNTDDGAQGLVFDIQSYALHDGPGIRTALFLKGCPLRCWWCHNPESQAPHPEWMSRPSGRERVGEWRSVRELVEAVLPDRPFFEGSGGGVTVTGGEPTFQPLFCRALLQAFRAEGIHTALETCGHTSWERLQSLPADLFLFDLKQLDSTAHRKGTGAGNAAILANFKSLVKAVGSARVIPRLPLVPGFNATASHFSAVLDFLDSAGFEGELHLLPVHRWARGKYAQLEPPRPYVEPDPLPAGLLEQFETLARERHQRPLRFG